VPSLDPADVRLTVYKPPKTTRSGHRVEVYVRCGTAWVYVGWCKFFTVRRQATEWASAQSSETRVRIASQLLNEALKDSEEHCTELRNELTEEESRLSNLRGKVGA
jgi:hypothetical protein